jgi:hypothetical protein
VSLPNSPGRGIVLNVHNSLPLRTSNARTMPLVLLCVSTVAPSRNDEPTIATSLTIAGRRVQSDLAVFEIDLIAAAFHGADFQIDHAVGAKPLIIAPVFALSATSDSRSSRRGCARRPCRRSSTRRRVPTTARRYAGAAAFAMLCAQISSPVAPSSATTSGACRRSCRGCR